MSAMMGATAAHGREETDSKTKGPWMTEYPQSCRSNQSPGAPSTIRSRSKRSNTMELISNFAEYEFTEHARVYWHYYTDTSLAKLENVRRAALKRTPLPKLNLIVLTNAKDMMLRSAGEMDRKVGCEATQYQRGAPSVL